MKIDKKALAAEMITLYCKGNHGGKEVPCKDCRALMHYAEVRQERCPFKGKVRFCSRCTIHCYQPAQREQIKKVMRYAGPRMLWHHPLLVIRHVCGEIGGRFYLNAQCREKR